MHTVQDYLTIVVCTSSGMASVRGSWGCCGLGGWVGAVEIPVEVLNGLVRVIALAYDHYHCHNWRRGWVKQKHHEKLSFLPSPLLLQLAL